MKALIVIALFLGMYITSYSQDKTVGGDNQGKMKTIDLPEIVIKTAGKDFSYYLPDKNPDPSVKQLQNEFIAYDLGKDYEGFENYLVILEGKKGVLSATYDSNGKLTSVVEKYDNIQLPAAVIYSIYKAYPGWHIVNDKFLYTQENGDVTKKRIQFKTQKRQGNN